MSSDAQAGTQQQATPENSNAGQGAATDGSGLNAQQQKEFMTLKQKAEEFNKLADEKRTLEARLAAMEQMISRGQGQATDPTAELVRTLREQAAYDPVAQATLMNMQMTAQAQAEAWLAQELVNVPAAKRDRVAGIVRARNYSIGVSEALDMVTDPDTMTLAEKLKSAEDEIARLKTARPNGSSPSATTPATASAGESGNIEEMKHSEYIAALRAGGPRAKELMKAAGENRLKLKLE